MVIKVIYLSVRVMFMSFNVGLSWDSVSWIDSILQHVSLYKP